MSDIEGEYNNQGASRRRFYKCKVSTRDQEEGMGLAGMEAWEQ